MPEFKKYKYSTRLATGSLATSGTLGILIPPSLLFVFYAIMTDNSIAELFIAGIIPGILTAIFYSGIIIIRCLVNPKLGPKGPKFSWIERFVSLKYTWPVITLFILVLGGIYLGIFTPTEASGIGASGALLIALIMRKLTWSNLTTALHETGILCAMLFPILIGGFLMVRFLAITELTSHMVNYIIYLNLNRYIFMVILVLMYLLLGSMLDIWGMLVLTIPFVYPIILELGFDPVWFGVFIVIMTELALVTPPIGGNVFVMRSIATDVPMHDIFMGVAPFIAGDLTVIGLLIAFPAIALWLPGL